MSRFLRHMYMEILWIYNWPPLWVQAQGKDYIYCDRRGRQFPCVLRNRHVIIVGLRHSDPALFDVMSPLNQSFSVHHVCTRSIVAPSSHALTKMLPRICLTLRLHCASLIQRHFLAMYKHSNYFTVCSLRESSPCVNKYALLYTDKLDKWYQPQHALRRNNYRFC